MGCSRFSRAAPSAHRAHRLSPALALTPTPLGPSLGTPTGRQDRDSRHGGSPSQEEEEPVLSLSRTSQREWRAEGGDRKLALCSSLARREMNTVVHRGDRASRFLGEGASRYNLYCSICVITTPVDTMPSTHCVARRCSCAGWKTARVSNGRALARVRDDPHERATRPHGRPKQASSPAINTCLQALSVASRTEALL